MFTSSIRKTDAPLSGPNAVSTDRMPTLRSPMRGHSNSNLAVHSRHTNDMEAFRPGANSFNHAAQANVSPKKPTAYVLNSSPVSQLQSSTPTHHSLPGTGGSRVLPAVSDTFLQRHTQKPNPSSDVDCGIYYAPRRNVTSNVHEKVASMERKIEEMLQRDRLHYADHVLNERDRQLLHAGHFNAHPQELDALLRSRYNIRDPLDLYSHYRFRSASPHRRMMAMRSLEEEVHRLEAEEAEFEAAKKAGSLIDDAYEHMSLRRAGSPLIDPHLSRIEAETKRIEMEREKLKLEREKMKQQQELEREQKRQEMELERHQQELDREQRRQQMELDRRQQELDMEQRHRQLELERMEHQRQLELDQMERQRQHEREQLERERQLELERKQQELERIERQRQLEIQQEQQRRQEELEALLRSIQEQMLTTEKEEEEWRKRILEEEEEATEKELKERQKKLIKMWKEYEEQRRLDAEAIWAAHYATIQRGERVRNDVIGGIEIDVHNMRANTPQPTPRQSRSRSGSPATSHLQPPGVNPNDVSSVPYDQYGGSTPFHTNEPRTPFQPPPQGSPSAKKSVPHYGSTSRKSHPVPPLHDVGNTARSPLQDYHDSTFQTAPYRTANTSAATNVSQQYALHHSRASAGPRIPPDFERVSNAATELEMRKLGMSPSRSSRNSQQASVLSSAHGNVEGSAMRHSMHSQPQSQPRQYLSRPAPSATGSIVSEAEADVASSIDKRNRRRMRSQHMNDVLSAPM